jgi:Fic family protein
MNNNRPWYYDWKTEIELACKFINKGRATNFSGHTLKSNYEVYYELCLGRIIYESNLIESAGLSLSDTKKIVSKNNNLTNPGKRGQIIKQLEQELKKKKGHKGYLSLSGKKRSTFEVYKHLMAILFAIFKSPGSFFSESFIKKIHFIMASGLMPKDAGIDAGNYRIDNRTTDFQTPFPAWQNVPEAMKLWVERSNDLMNSSENPVIKAARISYDFVAIHPFPDFNGRMSRLIMNMVLLREGLPFLVALKGNKKEKHKYMNSLRRANQGKIDRYACLIAIAVNNAFKEFNANLEKAGIEPILSKTNI